MKKTTSILEINPINQVKKSNTFSLWIYLILVVLISWPFQFWYAFKANTAFDKYFFSSLSMIMVTIATLIVGRFIFKDGFATIGWSFGKPIHYLFVFILALFLWLMPSLIDIFFELHKPLQKIVVSNILPIFTLRFVATLIPAFGEEFGWRGYMLPRLSILYGAKKGLIIHAFIWWFWHLPVLISVGIKSTLVGEKVFFNVLLIMLISIIPSMFHAIIFAFIWTKSKSIWVVTAYHSAFDEIRDALETTVGFGSLVELWQMIAIIIIGSILFWKVNWELLLLSHKTKLVI
jgi:uncharacterized protein